MAGFFFANIADAGFFDFFGGSDLDGGVALAGDPETAIGAKIKRNQGCNVGLHRLIFFQWECKDKKKQSKWYGDGGKEWKNLEESDSKYDHTKNDHKVDELSKAKRTKKLVVCFDVLWNLITRHNSILA